MFRGSPPNPYDEIVVRATDEAHTSENWSMFIEVCDKVINDKTPSGPRDCVAAIQKRLQHRNANVQLFCLTLTESLVKNTNQNLHKEVASRAFMKVLSGLVADRYTHVKVKKRVLQCLKSWSDDFHGKVNLGLVEETMEDLKSKGHRHEEETEPVKHPSNDVLKREEEELQRALAESEREAEWMKMAGVGNFPASNINSQSTSVRPGGYIIPQNHSSSGYSAPNNGNITYPASQPTPETTPFAPLSGELSRLSLEHSHPTTDNVLFSATGSPECPVPTQSQPAPRRVRASYDFEPSEEGELAFKEGDLIRVIDSAYKDWWKGELRGQIGIFPVNYVEVIPDPSPEAIARDAEAEAAVFAQAHQIDRLLQMMRTLDAKRDNLADNDELSELYQQTLSLRPKIVRLIEKYSQKKVELLQINAKFMTAKTTYDAMIEESLAKYHPGVTADVYTQPDPNFRPAADQATYGTHSLYPTPYGHERVPSQQPTYPTHSAMAPQPHQQPNILSTPSTRPQYPLTDAVIPEGIDTSRYYLASDGNWYAYSAEQLAAMAASTPSNHLAAPSTITAGLASHLQQPGHSEHAPPTHVNYPLQADQGADAGGLVHPPGARAAGWPAYPPSSVNQPSAALPSG